VRTSGTTGRRHATKLAALWLAMFSLAAGATPTTKEIFDVMDSDGDGAVSWEEYSTVYVATGVANPAKFDSIFIQADVNDDGVLTLQELDFASHLASYDQKETWMVRQDAALPKDFRAGIDCAFAELRKTARGGLTYLPKVLTIVRPLLQQAGIDFEDEALAAVSDLFHMADIVRDGALNMNELDYFQFMLRDFLVGIAVGMQLATQTSEYKKSQQRWLEVLFREFDQDRDGKLSLRELTQFFDMFGGQVKRLGYNREIAVRESFEESDINGDGVLDWEEAESLMDVLVASAAALS